MIHVTDNNFKDITIRGSDNFIAFIILSNSLRRKLKWMRTKEGEISSGTTIIVNQGASNYALERPITNRFSYYAYMLPRQPHYQLVSTSG